MCSIYLTGLFSVSKLPMIKASKAKPDMSLLRLVKESELRRGNMIGSGAFGTVYKVSSANSTCSIRHFDYIDGRHLNRIVMFHKTYIQRLAIECILMLVS